MPSERVCAEKGFDVYEFYFEGIFPTWAHDHPEVPKQHLFDFSDSQAKDQKWPSRWPPFKTGTVTLGHGGMQGILTPFKSRKQNKIQRHSSLKVRSLISPCMWHVTCHCAKTGWFKENIHQFGMFNLLLSLTVWCQHKNIHPVHTKATNIHFKV